MDGDHTLPASGAWVLLKSEPPTSIRVKPLSIFYAMPDRVFVEGSFRPGYGRHVFGQRILKASELMLIYRARYGSKALTDHEREEAAQAESRYLRVVGEDLVLEQRCRVETFGGSLTLNPDEYSIIADVNQYFDAIGEGYILHEYGRTAKITSRVEEQIYYMQTRGIPKAEALKLIGAGLKSPSMFWLEADDELLDFFGLTWRGAA